MFSNKKSQVFIVASIIIIVAFAGLITNRNLSSSAKSYNKQEFYSRNIYLDLKDTYTHLAYTQSESEVFNIFNETINYQLDNLLLNDLSNELVIIIAYKDKSFIFNHFNNNIRIVANPNEDNEIEYVLSKDSVDMVNLFNSFNIYDDDYLIGTYIMNNPVIILNRKED